MDVAPQREMIERLPPCEATRFSASGHINRASCCISIGWFAEAEVVICECDDQSHVQMHSPIQPPTFLTLTPPCVTPQRSHSHCGSCNDLLVQPEILRSCYQGKTMTSSGPLPYTTTLFSSSLHFNDSPVYEELFALDKCRQFSEIPGCAL